MGMAVNGSASGIIKLGDSPSADAFGRLRVSDPFTVFDSKLLYDKAPLYWDEVITNVVSATSTHSTTDSAVTMSVGGNGDQVERQTFQKFNYQPGKSQLMYLTGVLGSGVANVRRRLGAFGTNDGMFFELDGTTLAVVVRKGASDNNVPQSSWNIDRLDGSGASGITLDTSLAQIFLIDYEWLGVGRVRFGFNIDGVTYYCHEFLNANVTSSTYISTPNCPLRYEISSTGGTGSLVHICGSVQSEGGVQPVGTWQSNNLGTLAANEIQATVIGTTYAVCGIRLKTTHLDSTIDVVRFSVVARTADVFLWSIQINPTLSSALTYAAETNSAIEFAAGDPDPAITVTSPGQIVDSGYVSTQVRSDVIDISSQRRIGAAIDGTRDQLVLCAEPATAGLDILGSLTWRDLSG